MFDVFGSSGTQEKHNCLVAYMSSCLLVAAAFSARSMIFLLDVLFDADFEVTSTEFCQGINYHEMDRSSIKPLSEIHKEMIVLSKCKEVVTAVKGS